MIFSNPALAYVEIPSAFLTNELAELLRNAGLLNPPLKGWMRSAGLQRHSRAPEPLNTAVFRGRKSSFTTTLASLPAFILWVFFAFCVTLVYFTNVIFLCARKGRSLKTANLLQRSWGPRRATSKISMWVNMIFWSACANLHCAVKCGPPAVSHKNLARARRNSWRNNSGFKSRYIWWRLLLPRAAIVAAVRLLGIGGFYSLPTPWLTSRQDCRE